MLRTFAPRLRKKHHSHVDHQQNDAMPHLTASPENPWFKNGGLTPEAVNAFQRSHGNRYVVHLLREHAPSPAPRLHNKRSMLRRCPCGGTAPPGETECDACKQERLADEAQGTGDESIHRKGEEIGHDLTAAPFIGDPKLEDTFDGKRVIQLPEKGDHVTKIQTALTSLGFVLPQHGADGAYGGETVSAVREFQASAGMTGADVDGKIGRKTMGLLDMSVRDGGVETDVDAKGDDLKIKGKYEDSAEEPMTIFFDLGQAALDSEEQKKIEAIAKLYKNSALILKGTTSEEGAPAFNAQLAQQRIDSVSTALFEAQHDELHIYEPSPQSGVGDLHYRKRRAVKVLLEPEAEEQACPKNKSSIIDCPADRKSALTKAMPKAIKLIDNAEKALPPVDTADKKTRATFDMLFGTSDATRDDTVTKVTSILASMKKHIGEMSRPDRHRCANECDGICKEGSPAYNTDVGRTEERPNPPGVLTLCPAFVGHKDSEELILVHESHHGVPDIESRDLAYSDTRLITLLDTETALKNAASFHLFVSWVKDPAGTQIGPKEKDDPGNLTEKDHVAINLPIAWLHQWLHMASFDLSVLYSEVRDARSKGFYKDGRSVRMELVAPHFRLTPSPIVPTRHDQEAVAAIYDRVAQMEKIFTSPFIFSKLPIGGKTEWERGPGTKISLAQELFLLPPSRMMVALIQELVHATDDISAASEAEYVAMLEDLRRARNLGGPTP